MSVDKRMQVTAQCRVVSHLAMEIAALYLDLAVGHAAGQHDRILDLQGETTARLMNMLGDHLNNIDAANPDTIRWTEPIFERAQEMFPEEADQDSASLRQEEREEEKNG